MTDEENPDEHPIVDKVFDGLSVASKVGVALFIRGAKSAAHAIERSVELANEFGEHFDQRLKEIDRAPDDKPPKKPKKRAVVAAPKPHEPAEDDNGVLRDTAFSFLDRPDGEGNIPPE